MILWTPGYSLDEWEKIAIVQAMKFYRGNKTLASQSLGCAIRTIDAKLEKYAKEDAADVERDRIRKEEREVQLQRARGMSCTGAGICVESAAQISPQQQVPVREVTKVQAVLPQPTPKDSYNKAGRRV